MKANVVNLLYRAKEAPQALDTREEIVLIHRGLEKRKIVSMAHKSSEPSSISTLAAVGMWSDGSEPVGEIIASLRKPRSYQPTRISP
jgi:hypothetical protein